MNSDLNKQQVFSELITYRFFNFFHYEFISFFNKTQTRNNSKKRKIEEPELDANAFLMELMKW